MSQITIKVDSKLVRQGLQDLTKDIPEIGRLQIYRRAIHAKSRLAKPAPKPGYPINWDSIKQMVAFFASNGFGGGIPYRRTGKYEHDWDVVRLDNGYRLVNNSPETQYIAGNAYGQGQSKIHAGRWPLFRDVVEDEVENLDRDVEEHIVLAARRRGF